MNEHERSLAVAASAIDFPLARQDADTLARHLAICSTCTLAVQRLRDDAAALAGTERLAAPPHVRQVIVRAATTDHAPVHGGAAVRWSFMAAVLALLAVGGTFVAGAMLERLGEPVPTDPAAVVRPTDHPSATWQDLGDLTDAFEGRTVQMLIPDTPGLIAIGRDRRSAVPVVWTSDDGVAWNDTTQPADVFGGRVPTSGASWGDRHWVVGWQITVAAPQRAIWSSPDGESWSLVDDPSALLGTEASDLTMVAGPAGLLVWAPDGRVWTSTDGERWDRSDIGSSGVTDAAVDDSTFHVVGRDGDRAFVVSSTDGVSWSEPATRSAAAEAQVGIEPDASGTLLAWIGGRPFDVTRDDWRSQGGAASVPSVASPQDVVGGDGFAALDAPTSQGVQRAWVGDGTHDWQSVRSDAASGARMTVSAIGGDGLWYVLTRQGTSYRGWALHP